MSDRAEPGLSELIDRLRASLSRDDDGGVGPQGRAKTAEALVWCHVDASAIGDAFELLWSEASPIDPQTRLSLRAELQAYCGNERASLDLLQGLSSEHPGSPMVRARVAMARGDWPAAVKHAHHASGDPSMRSRAGRIEARAHLEAGHLIEARACLDRLDNADHVATLEEQLLRARAEGADAVSLQALATEASRLGALRIEADAWGDCARWLSDQGTLERTREAAVRAVEIWDDLATALPPPLRVGFWRDARRSAVRAWSRKRTQQHPASASPDALAPLLLNLRALASERDLPSLLGLITDGAVALTGAERGFVLLTDNQGALEPATVRDAEHELGTKTAAFSRSIAETVLIDREPVVTVDAVHDPRVQDYMSVHQLMLKSVACLPVCSGARMWGVLYLEHRSMSGRFSGTDLTLLQAYADQAAIALENAQLFEQVEQQTQALREANEALRHANEQLEHRLDGQSEQLRKTQSEIRRLRTASVDHRHAGLVGSSAPMRTLAESLERIAASGVPAVVFGESGTGKELVARAIHDASPRAGNAFVSLNCAAIPEGLLESELFGHTVGAFTGATRSHDGVFAQANGGTLFLDEVADMPPRMQLDLLRILQERKVRPVGGVKERAIDVRVIAASQRPLQALVDAGTFRDDLYYRLAVVELRVPPLRERREDIPQLCAHLLARHAEQTGVPKKSLSRDALARLARHPFPGNVRELEHLLINASVFARSHVIEADELALEAPSHEPVSRGSAESFASFKGAERERILATLNEHGWNRAQAARALGMPRRTFYRRLKEHSIELPKGR